MEPFQIGQGDTLPIIETPLLDSNGVVDLTDATAVRFHLRDPDDDSDDGLIIDAEATFTSDNQVAYVWQPGDTDVAGVFYAEFEVTFPSGTLTGPNTGEKQLLLINPQLG